MNLKHFYQLIKSLIKDYSVFGPIKTKKEIQIKQITELNYKNIEISNEIPLYSFKKYFIPPKETLFTYRNNNFKKLKIRQKKQIILGMSIFDLKSLLLYNHVFEKDPYYQNLMRNTIIIGQACISCNANVLDVFKEKYEENILEHLQFDIFIERENHKYSLFTGSEEGQKILEKSGFKDYEHIQFAGPIKEEGLDPKMIKIRDKLKKHNPKMKLWQDLGKKCIGCGKCSIICPTCFCFDIKDKPGLMNNSGKRVREWSSCFASEFSEITGGHKFLKNMAERIHNWYTHKFVRIPYEYNFPGGCTGCGRCIRVCPAEIDIRKVLEDILKS